jgi:hypothetical protein
VAVAEAAAEAAAVGSVAVAAAPLANVGLVFVPEAKPQFLSRAHATNTDLSRGLKDIRGEFTSSPGEVLLRFVTRCDCGPGPGPGPS